MKTFEFRQMNKITIVIVALVWFISVYGFCYVQFGGFSGMADAVNGIGSAKSAGLIVGFVFFVPFFVILRILMYKVKVNTNKLSIIKGGKAPFWVDFDKISSMEVNTNKIGKLDIKDSNNEILCSFEPQNKQDVIFEIIKEISNHINFEKQLGSRVFFGKTIETSIYTRKNPKY